MSDNANPQELALFKLPIIGPAARWLISVEPTSWLPLVLIAAGALFLDWSADKRAEREAMRVNLDRFQVVLGQAEKDFCRDRVHGLSLDFKQNMDVAYRLSQELDGQLLALDYISLASMGSYIWDYTLSNDLCRHAIDNIEEQGGSDLEKYAAHLIRGDLLYRKFFDTQSPESLNQAREEFNLAIRSVQSSYESLRYRHFAGEACKLWASYEYASGHNSRANRLFFQAAAIWSGLPNWSDRLLELSRVRSDICRGVAPTAPCPSDLLVTPSFALQSGTVADVREASIKLAEFLQVCPTGPAIAKLPPAPDPPADTSVGHQGPDKAVDAAGQAATDIGDLQIQHASSLMDDLGRVYNLLGKVIANKGVAERSIVTAAKPNVAAGDDTANNDVEGGQDESDPADPPERTFREFELVFSNRTATAKLIRVGTQEISLNSYKSDKLVLAEYDDELLMEHPTGNLRRIAALNKWQRSPDGNYTISYDITTCCVQPTK